MPLELRTRGGDDSRLTELHAPVGDRGPIANHGAKAVRCAAGAGSVQVGFQVFSDFMTYRNGTYFRTKSAQGPRGGHAVKLVGWGVDA